MRVKTAILAMLAATTAGCIPSVDAPAPTYDSPPPARATSPERPPQRGRLPQQDRLPRDQVDRSPPTRVPAPVYPARPADTDVTTLPAPRPAWEARPVVADARVVAETVYVVQPGDSLRRISERTNAPSELIARANAIPPPFTVRVSQRLTIPGGRYHLVRSGETGIAIARAYGVEWSRIVAENQLADPYILRTGQRVAIPGTRTTGSTAAERAAAFRLDVDDILTGSQPALAVNEAPAKSVATPRRVLPATVAIATPARLRTGFLWPVDGSLIRRFGRGDSGVRNDGIKIAAPLDTPIKAAADGVVAYVGDGVASLGGLVIVKHGDGWTSVYGHASKLMVQRGQSVKRGQTIALSGDSGFADQPEVHFELRRGRTPVDPLGQLPRR
ncbi:M23 family metallopeptidase [Sphingomonas sp. Leaf17]|uniref:M23 family metallopeptidase n=1 Tax=Sphingomonas sp. Leaf17 TaxID=1735683 RepID=UPI000B1B81B0|nr:M23 family metallopeptidase [Sphingomonas sp. Leaf17]